MEWLIANLVWILLVVYFIGFFVTNYLLVRYEYIPGTNDMDVVVGSVLWPFVLLTIITIFIHDLGH